MGMMMQQKGHMWLEGPAYGSYAQPRKPSAIAAFARIVARARAAREVALAVFAYFAYFLVRGFTEGDRAAAVSHAQRIVSIEKTGRFFWEPAIQERIVNQHAIVTAANWMYIWGHWPLIIVVAAWLMVRRPAAYSVFRNAFFISGTIGIIIFVLFPVAPPRLADVGVVDTVTMYSNSYRVLQPPAFVNQYAAMPSLHFGWDLLIGIALVTQAPWRAVRFFGAIVPLLMASAIVLTANHYIFDALAGGTVALIGLAIAYALRPREQRAASVATIATEVQLPCAA
jgi:hypothetical protein